MPTIWPGSERDVRACWLGELRCGCRQLCRSDRGPRKFVATHHPGVMYWEGRAEFCSVGGGGLSRT